MLITANAYLNANVFSDLDFWLPVYQHQYAERNRWAMTALEGLYIGPLLALFLFSKHVALPSRDFLLAYRLHHLVNPL